MDHRRWLDRPARGRHGARPGRAQGLGKSHGVKYLKAMQCNNIPFPLGQGLWEGVPLREVVRRVGKVGNVRRVYYWGFHNNDPAQLFQSSLPYNRVMETPPWEPPPLVAYRLNGGGYSPGARRAGAHGRAVGTRIQVDQVAAEDRPDQRLPGQRYLRPAEQRSRIVLEDGRLPRQGASFVQGRRADRQSRERRWSGGRGSRGSNSGCGRRPAADGKLADDDPAWKTAVWSPCDLMPPPDDWEAILPAERRQGKSGASIRRSGKPKDWPLLFSMVPWTARIRRPDARLVRAPRAHRRPERLRPARAASVSEIGHESDSLQNLDRDGLNAAHSCRFIPRRSYQSRPFFGAYRLMSPRLRSS